MTKNILFIASLSLLFATQVSAQKTNKAKTATPEASKPACTEPTTNSEFYEFFRHMKTYNGFDSDKLTEAEMAANTNCFTAKQVMTTLATFSYENTKVKFVKYMYKHVYDKANYSVVKEGLSEVSWKEIEEYMKRN